MSAAKLLVFKSWLNYNYCITSTPLLIFNASTTDMPQLLTCS